MADVLAIVPARGGSRGIVDKNLAEVAGVPLIAHTIGAAQRAASVSRLIVSTDSPAIAAVARAHGVQVPFVRPAELADDRTPTIPVLIHALDWLAEAEGYTPDLLVLLQPTSPLRTADDIDAAVALIAREADAVVSVCPARTHPALTRRVSDDGRLQPYLEAVAPPDRRQDAPRAYEINGAIYVIRPDVLRARQTWYTDHTLAYVMPVERSLDIDEPFDLELLRALLAYREKGGAG